jgi:hypothetical protein
MVTKMQHVDAGATLNRKGAGRRARLDHRCGIQWTQESVSAYFVRVA